MNLLDILGKKVFAVKGSIRPEDRRKKNPYISPLYILFDDGETYMELSEQDYYTYHDCSPSARNINVNKNKMFWENINKSYPDAPTLAIFGKLQYRILTLSRVRYTMKSHTKKE